jgi:DNA-binding NarL/FixJ family response regulator
MLVVILSSSNHPEEIQRAGALGANSNILKPQDPTELIEVVRGLQEYSQRINASGGLGEDTFMPGHESEVVQHLTFGRAADLAA